MRSTMLCLWTSVFVLPRRRSECQLSLCRMMAKYTYTSTALFKYKLTLYSDNTVSMDKCPSAKQSFQELSIPRKQTTPCWRHTTYYTPTWINLIHQMNQCSRSICECFGVIHHDHPVKLPRFQVPVNLSTSIDIATTTTTRPSVQDSWVVRDQVTQEQNL